VAAGESIELQNKKKLC